MSPIYVYVAGPLSVGDVGGNVGYACGVGWALMQRGYVPYVPHLTHYWDQLATSAGFLPRTWDQWLTYDERWLAKCDVVLRLSGESRGADREELFARKNGIPVVYSRDDLYRRFPLNSQTSALKVCRCGHRNCPLCYGAPEG